MSPGLVAFGSHDYHLTVALRLEVLREPLGLTFSPQELSEEADHLHLATIQDGQCLACLVLVPIDQSTVRMRQVAVRPNMQRGGLGRSLVRFAESLATDRGWSMMTLHARLGSVAFYTSLEYTVDSDVFEEVGIDHLRMSKSLTRPGPGPFDTGG